VFQLVAALAPLFLAEVSPAQPLLLDLHTCKSCMMIASKQSDKGRKKDAFYKYFSSTTTKMSRRNINDQHEDSLVSFITLCADGETASQINGIDKLQEVAWELLTKGRTGELDKENFEDIRCADDEEDDDDSEEKEAKLKLNTPARSLSSITVTMLCFRTR